ncbi:TetR/AcrR family transcriptional regulator [Croceicoccus bisphenolivorans]|uniref:TetR/AcrR family transcriptional regulator n=1 Tax=Croceicoccus bisphenolivorans TaxID=1783232 RepID=UPI0008378A3B|nr:TetR/AcrR family transcriptional regulator [Croceicoccus bisphenolivorans]
MSSQSPFRNREQKQADREAKRQAVLLAAVRMFNERGYHATSLDDVAASLGISKPTIYHYLGNKEQVLLSCLRAGLDRLIDTAVQAGNAPGNGADRLKTFLIRYAEFNMTDFGRCVILTNDNELSADGAEQLRADKRKIHGMMRDMIEDGRKDGSVVCDDANLLAFTIAGALNWPSRWFRSRADGDARLVAGKMVAMLAAGFDP